MSRAPFKATSSCQFKIYGMDCAEEISMLQKALSPQYVSREQLHFDLLNGRLTIYDLPDKSAEQRVLKAILQTGLRAEYWETYQDKQTKPVAWYKQYRLGSVMIAGFLILIGYVIQGFHQGFLFALVSHDITQGALLPLISILCYGLSIFTVGAFLLPKAWSAIKHFRPDMHLLMMIAVIGAIIIGQWFEAAMVVFLFSVALLLESWSVDKARNAIKALLSIAPTTACVVDETEQTVIIPVESVNVGAKIIIQPGEKVPLDATVLEGESHINQASITGESQAQLKKVGMVVYAGTLNQEGVLLCQVIKTSKDTAFAQIIKRVEEAQASKAQSEQWVERFAYYYTPFMIIVAMLVMIVPPLLFSGVWLQWIYEGLVILVIACPCALVISTPVSIVAGLCAAARAGVLVKGGSYLELAGKLKVIAFDKTGTITQGKPEVITVLPVNGWDKIGLLQIAASLEKHINHPLATAIYHYALQQGVSLRSVQSVQLIQGKGLVGEINQQRYWIGSHRLLHESIKESQELEKIHQEVLRLEDAGHSLLIVGQDNQLCGLISVADAVRPMSVGVIRQLKRLGLVTALLTGDNPGTANAIGSLCYFDNIYSELLPDDKVEKIKILQSQYKFIGMVGDGINDAPALATANVSIAMGVMGSDVAIEAADIALMTDNLDRIPWLIQHARRTLRIIQENIGFALAIKALFIGLALIKFATLWMAIAADTGASLLVVANGLRLLNRYHGRYVKSLA